MTKLYQCILALNSLSLGIIIPVFNLALLERGASLQTLPLLIAVYSITILCLELPSGICADLYGRKTVFLLSCCFLFASLSFFLAADNLIWLMASIILNGLSRAFSSGGLDALVIDSAISKHGESCLNKVTARMSILDGAGLAVGGIAGGFIAGYSGNYSMNITLRLGITVLVFILCLFFIKEQPLHDVKQCTNLFDHMKQGKKLIFTTPLFGLVFAGIFCVGFFLSSIETFWQPAFMEVSIKDNSTWILGFVTFLSFIAVVIGNVLAQKLLDKFKNIWKVYNICYMFFAGCLFLFAFQKGTTGFILWYAAVYMTLGTGNVIENTLVNKLTPSHMRASILSLKSFVLQIGAISAALFSSIMIERLHFAGIWIIAACLLGSYSAILAAARNRKISVG